MAVMNLSPEQQRHAVVEPALVSNAPANDFHAVRDITPLVMQILMMLDSPFAPGGRGLKALGVDVDEAGKPLCNNTQLGILMMTKSAEVIVLVSCSDDELYDVFALQPNKVTRRALEMVNTSTAERMSEASVFISRMLDAMAKSRAVISDDEEKPSAKALAERGIKKKQLRTGSGRF